MLLLFLFYDSGGENDIDKKQQGYLRSIKHSV